MIKKLCVLALAATSISIFAQTSHPTKTAPTDTITQWRGGLDDTDIRLVNRITRGKSDEDRWMIYTAIVRNREASMDIYKGEPLTDDKVLANVRVRMSTDEAYRWGHTWQHMSPWDHRAMVKVLHDILVNHW